MNETMTIRISDWRCKANHGVYPEEKTAGGEFEVNIEITYRITGKINDISETISYVDILGIVAGEMSEPRPLLETVAMDSVEAIKQKYPGVVSCTLTIDKLRAPIPGLLGRVGVRYHKNFEAI